MQRTPKTFGAADLALVRPRNAACLRAFFFSLSRPFSVVTEIQGQPIRHPRAFTSYGHNSIIRSVRSETGKRGGSGEFFARRAAARRRGTRDGRVVWHSPWADYVRHLRRFSGWGRAAGAPLGKSRGSVDGKSLAAFRATAGHREGRCSCGEASQIDASLAGRCSEPSTLLQPAIQCAS